MASSIDVVETAGRVARDALSETVRQAVADAKASIKQGSEDTNIAIEAAAEARQVALDAVTDNIAVVDAAGKKTVADMKKLETTLTDKIDAAVQTAKDNEQRFHNSNAYVDGVLYQSTYIDIEHVDTRCAYRYCIYRKSCTAVPDTTHAYIHPAPPGPVGLSYCLLTSLHHRSLLSPTRARTHSPSLTTANARFFFFFFLTHAQDMGWFHGLILAVMHKRLVTEMKTRFFSCPKTRSKRCAAALVAPCERLLESDAPVSLKLAHRIASNSNTFNDWIPKLTCICTCV